MKVVIFCGGLGVRMGEATYRTPKPMITVGGKPILWHIMQWYASWGHTEFVLCLGYKADAFRNYFSSNGASANGASANGAGHAEGIEDWRITFLDTGVRASIGDRLMAAREHLADDELFLCTYGDGLTDAPLDDMIETLQASGRTGLFMTVRPRLSYHVVESDEKGNVASVEPMSSASVRINGGFFVFRREIFDHLRPNEDVMDEAARLARAGELIAYRYDGFWAPMDTLKDKQDLDEIAATGSLPWLPSRTQLASA
jgi:glucose-1-phosphate cytidylyltransferase